MQLCAEGTRGAFWARKNGGGWRTARKSFTCQQSLCLRRIAIGQQYFDTLEALVWPRTKRICLHCASEMI
jgi:hypothetical protein